MRRPRRGARQGAAALTLANAYSAAALRRHHASRVRGAGRCNPTAPRARGTAGAGAVYRSPSRTRHLHQEQQLRPRAGCMDLTSAENIHCRRALAGRNLPGGRSGNVEHCSSSERPSCGCPVARRVAPSPPAAQRQCGGLHVEAGAAGPAPVYVARRTFAAASAPPRHWRTRRPASHKACSHEEKFWGCWAVFLGCPK